MPGYRWSKEEDEALTNVYSTERDFQKVYDAFPSRSVDAIWIRARTLGLHRNSELSQDVLPLTPPEAAYLAGVLDGEGTISLQLNTRNRATERRAIVPRVKAFNSDQRLLEWIRKTTGLNMVVYKANKGGVNCKQVYQWQVGNRTDCARLLRAVLPYLVLKIEQAQIVLRFCEQHQPYQSVTEIELEMVKQIRALNRRGTG